MPSAVTIAAVVDDHPRFCSEFVLWAVCVNRHWTGNACAYLTFKPSSSLETFATRYGIELRSMTPPIPEAPHCNKIFPFLDVSGRDDLVLTDADVFLTADLMSFFDHDAIRLAPNYHGAPPFSVFETVFKARGRGFIPERGVSLFPHPVTGSRETYGGNVNAGVIAVPSALGDFAPAWKERAIWLTENRDMLGHYAYHIDQISFAITMAETGLPFRFLPPQANAMIQILPELETVYALHLTSGHIPKYPNLFSSEKTMSVPQAKPAVAAAIETLNETIRQAMSHMVVIEETRDFAENFLNPAYRR